MSAQVPISALKTMKKPELKDLAASLGLSVKGLRSDLEERIKTYYDQREKAAVETSRRSISRQLPSTNKKATRGNLNGDSRSEESDDSADNNKREENPDEEISEGAAYDDGSRSRQIRDSPAEPVIDTIKRVFRLDAINDTVSEVRNYVTSTKAFILATLFLQFAIFLYVSIEWIKVGKIPIGFLSTETREYSLSIRGPDLSVLGEWHRFWRPILVYLAYLLALPTTFAYVFNFEPNRHAVSPLAFSVAQYCILFVSTGNLDWTEDVRDFIPESIIYSCAGASVVFALYEIVLDTGGDSR